MVILLLLACTDAGTGDSPSKETAETDSSGGDSDSAAPYVGCSDEPFVAFDVGSDVICGIRADGCLDCASADVAPGLDHHLDEPPTGSFTQVSMSDGCVTPSYDDVQCRPPEHGACATDASGGVSCWGWPFDEQEVGDSDVWVDPPATGVAEMALGYDNAAGLLEDGSVECWGAWAAGECDPAIDHSFVQLVAGDGYACGLTEEGVAVCWGFSEQAWGMQISEEALAMRQPFLDSWGADGPYERLVATPGEVCGLRRDGTTSCFDYYGDWLGVPRAETTLPTTEEAAAFSNYYDSRADAICVLDTDGHMSCDDDDLAVDVDQLAPYSFVAMRGSDTRICGLTAEGEIVCAVINSDDEFCPFCTELWD